jgi:hypothetical protein
MIFSSEQAQPFIGADGVQAFVELGFDSLFYIKKAKDPVTEQEAFVLYSGLGMPAAYYLTLDEALGVAIQNGIEVQSLH